MMLGAGIYVFSTSEALTVVAFLLILLGMLAQFALLGRRLVLGGRQRPAEHSTMIWPMRLVGLVFGVGIAASTVYRDEQWAGQLLMISGLAFYGLSGVSAWLTSRPGHTDDGGRQR